MSSDERPDQPPRVKPARRRAPDRVVEVSAGGVVVRLVQGRPHVLLIRDPYRKWGLPKGHLEEGEDSQQAALREVREETGLSDLILGPDLGEIDWTFRQRGRLVHKFCRFFLMSSPRSDIRPEVAEGISECKWLLVEEALRTIAYDNARVILQRGSERVRETWRDGEPFWRED
ncbi:MAG: NUDIX domain-containing protein [Gemmatimonadota bacterium]